MPTIGAPIEPIVARGCRYFWLLRPQIPIVRLCTVTPEGGGCRVFAVAVHGIHPTSAHTG
eukprot:scaffold41177_cov41-Tisochrysis_lutea.AAC.3